MKHLIEEAVIAVVHVEEYLRRMSILNGIDKMDMNAGKIVLREMAHFTSFTLSASRFQASYVDSSHRPSLPHSFGRVGLCHRYHSAYHAVSPITSHEILNAAIKRFFIVVSGDEVELNQAWKM